MIKEVYFQLFFLNLSRIGTLDAVQDKKLITCAIIPIINYGKDKGGHTYYRS